MRKLLKKISSAGRSKHTREEKKDRIHVAVIPVVKSEAQDEDIPYVPPRASLEGLPVEIQSAVLLNICDIASLQRLVHASPIYHSVYIRQRQAILERVLFNSIHSDVLYDAFAAITSRTTLTSNLEDRVARVKAFLLEYKDDRNTWTSPEHLDLESVSRLARLQNQVQHATEDLCQQAFSSYPFIGNQVEIREQLSSNERRRFHRAFYRFEIFCTLFRDCQSLSDALLEDGDITPELDSTEKSSLFLSLFNPWEVEELACVRDYFYNYYRRMLHKFEPDLRDRNPNVDLSDDGPWLEENIEYLMALSLRFYRRIEISSPDRQVGYLNYGLTCGSPSLSDALKTPSWADVCQYMATDEPVEIHFQGDKVRSGLNVMWLWTTGNTMDFGYFDWQNEPLREWGYVFWDQQRLKKWGVPDEEYETWVERRRARLRKALAEDPRKAGLML